MSDEINADFFNPDFIMEMNIILCVLHKQFRFLNSSFPSVFRPF